MKVKAGKTVKDILTSEKVIVKLHIPKNQIWKALKK